ncbi:NUDIX domain-containing protein [Iodobacter ciconiae]|nr:NUDIX hydrolase [Iodobacter ciconiae]
MEYTNPLFTVDSVLFTVKNEQLLVLLTKRAQAPFTGCWGLPGGFIDVQQDTNTDATASRKLEAKAGLKPAYLEQLQVISGPDRDPRGFSVTLAYFALVAYQNVSPQISSVESASWIAVNDLEKINLAFDHLEIIQIAKQRLQQKTLYSMTPVFCLPTQFTIGQLKSVIETIIEKPIQRKSLMRRIEASDIFDLSEKKIPSGGRMAQLYTLKPGADLVNFERNLNA